MMAEIPPAAVLVYKTSSEYTYKNYGICNWPPPLLHLFWWKTPHPQQVCLKLLMPLIFQTKYIATVRVAAKTRSKYVKKYSA